MIKLLDLYEFENRPREGALHFLYELMAERLEDPYVNISHTKLPTWEEHVNFVCGRPYQRWMLAVAKQDDLPSDGGIWVGYVSATRGNEIGIIIRTKWRGRGFGSAAVREFINMFTPSPAIASRRSGSWLANINPLNEPSVRMFQKLGFRCLQATYKLDFSNAIEDKSVAPVQIEHRRALEEGKHGQDKDTAQTDRSA